MRKELVLIVSIVVGAALVAYNWSGRSPLTFHSARGVVSSEALPVPTPKPPSKDKASAARSHPSSRVQKTEAAPQEATNQAVGEPARPPDARDPMCCSSTELPFPTPAAVRVGSTSRDIIGRYGDPAFQVTGSSGGGVIEKYFYLKRDRSRLTILIMKNGLLTSASELPGSYFELPVTGTLKHRDYSPKP